MKKNDIIELQIEDITNLGFGVGRSLGAVVFVAGGVPGDVVRAKIIKAASSYYVGKIEEFIKKSDKRTSDRCKNPACHSCAYKNISYENELEIKESTVRQAFIKAGLPDIKIAKTVPSPTVAGYRNKAQYPIKKSKNGELVIGFYAPKSHNVCEAADCPLSPPIFKDIIEFLRAFFKRHNFSVYDELTGAGLLRHIYLRRAECSGEVLLTLVINGENIPHEKELVEGVVKSFPAVCGILLNVNRDNTNVILGEQFITVWGKDCIEDTLAGVRLKITAPAFYQVNRATAELIYNKAKELANPKATDLLLDLYCGAGSIGLSMADEVGELVGIEIVQSAVDCAKYNAEINGVRNANFYVGDASDARLLLKEAEKIRGKELKPDVVVLDPPRAGSTTELIDYVSSLSPRAVIYISCNPTTLARDVKDFMKNGYTCDEVYSYDMFPLTGHVESVVCLTRE